MTAVDVEQNSAATKWTKKQLVGRLLWAFVQPVFAIIPRPFWAVRRSILRVFGARIGKQVHVFPTVRITIPWNLEIGDYAAVGDRVILYALGPIVIGPRATVSQNAHLCGGSHNYKSRNMELLKLPIEIKADAWVCADAFVGPGLTIGEGAIVGARSVVTKSVASNAIVGGNPAAEIGRRVFQENIK